MNFTAIDFETANGKRDSACALGIVRVEDGIIIEQKSWLICPPDLYFNPINISVHGITPQDVCNMPRFKDIWDEISPLLENKIILAHNASFDLSVLRACMTTYNISFPSLEYLCTVQISRRLWPQFTNHKLNTLAAHFSFPLKHHDALDDTLACARIAMEACKTAHCTNIYDLAEHLCIQPGRIYSRGYKAPCRI